MSTVADLVDLVACSPNVVIYIIVCILLVWPGVVVWIVPIHDEWYVFDSGLVSRRKDL
jgi:hypothetical protein